MKSAIVVSASSGIGEALCRHWAGLGWKVFGTYRTESRAVEELKNVVLLTQCDLRNSESIAKACSSLTKQCPVWDVLVLAAGALEPVGSFLDTPFEDWKQGVEVNFLQQMQMVHTLLPHRNLSATPEPAVLFFAGGGTNNAITHFTSYAISKLALTKMCEFLDAEIPDTRFTIVGPGWVKTKIHESTIRAGREKAGSSYAKTLEKMRTEEWVPMEQVVACCTWIVNTSSKAVRGRNFSVANDLFGEQTLEQALESDPDMYKLRRHQNQWQPKKKGAIV